MAANARQLYSTTAPNLRLHFGFRVAGFGLSEESLLLVGFGSCGWGNLPRWPGPELDMNNPEKHQRRFTHA